MARKSSTVTLGLTLALVAAASAAETDVAAIEEVVTRAYVEGIHKEGDPEKIRSGFHSDFVMFVNADEGILKITRDQWIARIEERNRDEPERVRPEIEHQFSLVEVTGDTAVARVELHRDGKHTFTDYLSLYRTGDGWKIVGKIFERHP